MDAPASHPGSAPATPATPGHPSPGRRGPAPAITGLTLIGGGGHAVVVAEAAVLGGSTLRGFLDDNPAAALAATLLNQPQLHAPPPCLGMLERLELVLGSPMIIAIGQVSFRRTILTALRKLPAAGATSLAAATGSAAGPVTLSATLNPVTIAHPAASISPTATLGRGIYIGPQAVIHSRARIGDHAIINTGAIIEHDCTVGENAHIAPGAILGGGVTVGEDTLIGMGSRILPHVTVGRHATVAAGAIVLDHVPDNATAIGVWGKR